VRRQSRAQPPHRPIGRDGDLARDHLSRDARDDHGHRVGQLAAALARQRAYIVGERDRAQIDAGEVAAGRPRDVDLDTKRDAIERALEPVLDTRTQARRIGAAGRRPPCDGGSR
jgi:hypothetical protein